MIKVHISRLLSRMLTPIASISAFTLLLSGCGGAHFNATPTPTVNITASPATISAGSSATLTVSATNATSLTVSGSDGSSYTLPATGGTQSVSPKTTTTYTATANGLSGQTTATMTVTVSSSSAPPAPTVTLTASPTSITAGGSSTLTVAATNATGVTVSGSDGSTYTLQANGGTQAVSPTATTTYTATATGTGGKITAAATVTVTAAGTPPPAPTVTITAAPTSISAGSSSTLTVVAANATGVTVTGSDGSSYTLQAAGGTQSVSPVATTTYTATATGAGGKTTATATVTVTPAGATTPTVTISASPTTITAGGSSTLTVAATNATTVTVSGSDGSNYTLQANGGVQAITPAATTTYTATATGAGGKVTATTTVTVTPVAPPAPTVTITATPTTILAGNSSTLMVAATNATTVTVTGTDGSSYTLQANGGSQAVTPAVSTTYTVTATGAGGKATATATVTVTPAAPPAPTVSIVANPASITTGASSTLTVTAANATGVTVAGSDGSSYTLTATGGPQVVSPTTTTTYIATANGAGGSTTATAIVTVTAPAATVTITANPTTIFSGGSSTLTVVATNATAVTVTGTDGSSYNLTATGGPQIVSPTTTTTATTVTYTATATGTGASATATATVTVNPAATVQSINHVIFMLQENHTFDNYFGMLNPYREKNGYTTGDDGVVYTVDGIDDKLTKFPEEDDAGTTFNLFPLTSTCVDDQSSDWLASYGDVNRYNFLATRPIQQNGFVHNAEGYATACGQPGAQCSGTFTDFIGQRAMGYYDEKFLNYYYYMASQFATSNRWFSPVSDKSIDNRIATFTGGTTQGLVLDPGGQDHLNQLNIPTIFNKLDKAGVSWKVYYTVSLGFCVVDNDDCKVKGINAYYPATDFSTLAYSFNYLYIKAPCTGTTQPSSVVGDPSNSFCIDPNHIAPLKQYYSDLANGTLPQFAFIEAGYANNDEHPGSGQEVLWGQQEVANVVNAFMGSSSWNDSVFFFSYDEGGGPFDHVPPVPGHSNQNTDASLLASTTIPDISTIAVNADNYYPCQPAVAGSPTTHCDLPSDDWPGDNTDDAPAKGGFAAQLGFRLPNIIISPFTRRHYVSNIPMDHTAILRFVEDRFIGDHQYLTGRDAVQPNLLDFFDFNNVPWATPPTTPVPTSDDSLRYNSCTPANFVAP
jgi:phospholipase C